MPLGRFGLRNEYGLGGKELYEASVQTEDPKAVLDGVAVAGLVGLLRQLGDLSQFAAEVFHGLQEQLASTGSRSRKLVNRIQHVEASLPSLEKAMLSQTSHIHFAYQPGSNWHPRIKKEQNHFISNDLPHFIMDSYEECREPPRLQLLDRFDNHGPGSCLKRYTDPTFFRKVSTSSEARNKEKSQQERKARKFKRRRSRQLSGRLPSSVHNADNSRRAQISSQTGGGESSLSHTSSTFDRTFTSDMRDQSDSRNSKENVGFVGSLSHPSISIQPDQLKNTDFVSNMDEIMEQTSPKSHLTNQTATSRKDCQAGSSTDDTAPRFSNVTWDEKQEIMEHVGVNNEIEDSGHLSPEMIDYLHEQDLKPVGVKSIDKVDDLSQHGSVLKSSSDQHYIDAVANLKLKEPTGLHYQYEHDMTHADADQRKKDDLFELGSSPESNITSLSQEEGLSEHGSSSESNSDGTQTTAALNWDMELIGKDSVIDEVQDVDKSTFDLHERDFVHVNSETFPRLPSFSEVENNSHEQSLVVATPESFPQLARFDKGEISQNLITNGNFVNDRFDSKLSIGDIQYMIETIDNGNWAIETVVANQVGTSSPPVENLSEGENARGSLTDGNWLSEFDDKLGVGDSQCMLETNLDNAALEPEIISDEYGDLVETFAEGANNWNVIEWHNHDDIDSETDNFVDALYTIDSESESDVETYTKKEVQPLSSICKWDESASTDLKANEVNHSETEHEFHSRGYDREEGANVGTQEPTAVLSLGSLECLEIPESPKHSEAATGHEQDVVSHSSLEQSRESAPSFLEKPHGVDACDNGDEINLEPVVCKSVESRSQVSGANEGLDDPTAILSLDNLECLESPVLPKFSESAIVHEQDAVSHSSHEQSRESAPSFSEKTHGIDVCDNGDEINLEPAVHKPVESSSQVSHQDDISCTPHVSGQMSFESTNSYSPAFWSNGTLFGLQPSKPTVISMSNPVSAAPVSSGNADVVDQYSPRVDNPAGAMSSVKTSYPGNNLGSDSQDVGSLNHVSKGVSGKKNNKSLPDDETIINNDAVARDLGNGHVPSHKITVPAGPVSKNVFGEVTNTGEDRPSILSLLAQNLLKNGLRRSGSWGYEDKSKPNNPVATNVFDNRSSEAVSDLVSQTNFNNGKTGSPVNSPPPSPPLEHMKISFRPLGGFETSRLKLKYPEGIDHHEMTIETFPSFQLVPESTRLQHDLGSDSDDDTFCRSYPCISDYSLSHRSDSDSEQWETGDTSDSNDHEALDGLRRISSLNSACSSSHFDDIDPRIYSMSGPTSQLPTLGSTNKFSYEEMKVCLNPEAYSSHFPDLTSQPPPLPPLQWHISKRLSHATEKKPEQGSKSLNQSFDSQILESAIPLSMQDLDVAAKQEKVAEPKVDDQKQSYHGDNGRIIDEHGDFLHQIRTKSFNLKRTDAAQSGGTSSLASNNKVTAILQKANAIRQVVGSEGEDDSWSDT
ncbi:hypothetical protein vseg_007296 [Gypsophila vaccaria]